MSKANKTTVLFPKVRLIGTAAIVTYTRVVQSATTFACVHLAVTLTGGAGAA